MNAAATGRVSWAPIVRGLGPLEEPTVGVVAALNELVDDIEEVLSARAKGAIGGGLEECMGGLKGLDTSPTPGFPGGSFGRDGGRGGGGGGVVLLQGTKGVAGRAGEDAPVATVSGEPVRGGVAGTAFGGRGGGVPVGKGLASFGDSMLGLIGWPEPHISG